LTLVAQRVGEVGLAVAAAAVVELGEDYWPLVLMQDQGRSEKFVVAAHAVVVVVAVEEEEGEVEIVVRQRQQQRQTE
jgi:hypothetical protein